MSDPKESSEAPKQDKGVTRRGRVHVTTTEQLRSVTFSHYKITEKDKYHIYYYSYRMLKWELLPEDRGMLPDDLRIVIKPKEGVKEEEEPVITSSGPDGTSQPVDDEDWNNPGPPTKAPAPLPPDLAVELPVRKFLVSFYYGEKKKRGPITADRNEKLLKVLFTTFKVKGIENFLIEYYKPVEKKWVPFPIPDYILKRKAEAAAAAEEEKQGDDEKKPKEPPKRIIVQPISPELPDRLHICLLDKPKEGEDPASLVRPKPIPYPGAEKFIQKMRKELNIKRFTILLYYKDAKKKGRISVENSEDLKKLVYETFNIKYPSENHVLEYFNEPDQKDMSLPVEVRARGGSWVAIPQYDPRGHEYKNVLTEEERKQRLEEFLALPDPIKLLVRDQKTSPKLDLDKLEIPSEWKEYHNEKFGISVRHPPGFQFFVFDFPGQPLTSVTFVNPAQPLGQVVLMLEDHPIKLNVEEYHEKSMVSLRMMSGSVVNIAEPMELMVGAGGLAIPKDEEYERDPSTGKKMKMHKGIMTRFRVKNFQSMGQTFHVWQGAVTNTFTRLRSFLIQNISPQNEDPNVKIARLMFHSMKIFLPDFLGRLDYFSWFGRLKLRLPSPEWYVSREIQSEQSRTGIIFQGSLLDRKKIEEEKQKRILEKQKQLAERKLKSEDPETGEILLTEEDIQEINSGLLDINADVVWNTKVLGGIRIMQHSSDMAKDKFELLQTFKQNYLDHGKVKEFHVDAKDKSMGTFVQAGFHSAIKVYKFSFKDKKIERVKIEKPEAEKEEEKKEEEEGEVKEEPEPKKSGKDILADALSELDLFTPEPKKKKRKGKEEEEEDEGELVIHTSDEEGFSDDEDEFSDSEDDYEYKEKEVDSTFYYSVVLQSKKSEEDLRVNLIRKVFPSVKQFTTNLISSSIYDYYDIDPIKRRRRKIKKTEEERKNKALYAMRNQDFIRYTNPDFNFSVSFPIGMEIKEHADSDPVVTMTSPALTMDGKFSKTHFEIAVSCRAAPMKMTLHEVYTMLKEQYRTNKEIKVMSLKRDEKNRCCVAHFRQKPEGITAVNIDQEHRRDQLYCLNFYVTSYLLTETKTATLRTVCWEENPKKSDYLSLFRQIHNSIKFDIKKIQNNENYKPIVV